MTPKQKAKTQQRLVPLLISGLVVLNSSIVSATQAVTCPANPTSGYSGGDCEPPKSSEVDPALLASINAQIAENQKKLDTLTEQQGVYEQQINTSSAEIRTLESQLDNLNNSIALTQLSIDRKQIEIDSLGLEMKSLQLSIDTKNQQIDQQKDLLVNALRTLDANSRVSTLSLMMQYANFGEFFSQAQAQAQISESLNAAIQTIQSSKAELVSKQGELSAARDSARQTQLVLKDEQRTVEAQQAYKVDLLNDSKGSQRQLQLLLDDNQSNAQTLQTEIIRLHATLQAKLNAADGVQYDLPSPSGFIWPVPGRKINAYFMDPNYGLNSGRHYGLDVDADQLTPVKSTALGKVVRVDPPVMENANIYPSVVKIQHGSVDGRRIDTLYLHLTQIYVNVGDYVTQGQIIGLSGGRCYTPGAGKCHVFTTGDHLHYEMHANDVPVNPLPYLP